MLGNTLSFSGPGSSSARLAPNSSQQPMMNMGGEKSMKSVSDLKEKNQSIIEFIDALKTKICV
jgi:hypothetical protein